MKNSENSLSLKSKIGVLSGICGIIAGIAIIVSAIADVDMPRFVFIVLAAASLLNSILIIGSVRKNDDA